MKPERNPSSYMEGQGGPGYFYRGSPAEAQFFEALKQARDVLYRQGCSDGATAIDVAIDRLSGASPESDRPTA